VNYLQLSVQQLEVFEGRIPWMYLDSKGNATVGVGQLLANVQAALALPFLAGSIGGTMVPATEVQVRDNWSRIMSIGKGRTAKGYDWNGAVVLAEEEIDALLLRTVTAIDAKMPALYPGYASWPVPPKLAVIDMDYNMGPGGLAKFHQMNAALNLSTPNWKVAASQCEREVGVAAFEARNAWTEYQFLQAANVA
jgi:GH24 family phage-related lysozyme (muramidase)